MALKKGNTIAMRSQAELVKLELFKVEEMAQRRSSLDGQEARGVKKAL